MTTENKTPANWLAGLQMADEIAAEIRQAFADAIDVPGATQADFLANLANRYQEALKKIAELVGMRDVE